MEEEEHEFLSAPKAVKWKLQYNDNLRHESANPLGQFNGLESDQISILIKIDGFAVDICCSRVFYILESYESI